MSDAAYSPSLWDRVDENDPVAPRYCPHCGEQLAHPDDLEDNDDVDVADRYAAYRRHRQTHYAWGDDITDQFGDDPYLADSYDTTLTDDGKRVKGDADEARGRADFEPFPATIMNGVWLVHNVQDNDYNVEWSDEVERPAALRSTEEVG